MIRKASITILVILILTVSLTACSSDSDDEISPDLSEQTSTMPTKGDDDQLKPEIQEYELYIEILAKGLLHGSYTAIEDSTAADAFMNDAMSSYDDGHYGLASVYMELAAEFYSKSAAESYEAVMLLQEATDGYPSTQLRELAQNYADLCGTGEQLASLYQGACEYFIIAFDYYYGNDHETGDYWFNTAYALLEEESELLDSYNSIISNISKLDLQDVEVYEYEAYIENLAKGLLYGAYMAIGDSKQANAFVNDAMQSYEIEDYDLASVYVELAAKFYGNASAESYEAVILLQAAADGSLSTQLNELAQGYADLCGSGEQLASLYQGACEYFTIAFNYYYEGDYETGDYWFNMAYALLEEENELLDSYNDLISEVNTLLID